MTVTTLDPTTALVVVDLQKGIVSTPTIHPMTEVVANACALAEAFRARGLPIVFVNVDGGSPARTEQPRRLTDFPEGWTELIPELNRRPDEHLVTKRTWGAFTNTGLDAHLKGLGATQIVLTGVATSVGVESTARQAQELGYNIALAIDAMTDRSAEAHDNSVTRIFPRLGETGTTHDIIHLLAKGT